MYFKKSILDQINKKNLKENKVEGMLEFLHCCLFF